MKLFPNRDAECDVKIILKVKEDRTTIVISQPK